MNKTEYLLSKLGEECAETSQMCSKSAIFGLTEVYAGQPFTNAERLVKELDEAIAVYEMLLEEGLVPERKESTRIAKKEKVLKYMEYSRSLGTLEE